MKSSFFGFLVVGVLLTAIAATADDAKDEAIKKDRKQIEGTWRIVALEIDVIIRAVVGHQEWFGGDA